MITFLTFITTLMLGLFVINITKFQEAFDTSFESSGCVDNMIMIADKEYREEYLDILRDEYGVERLSAGKMLFGLSASVIEDDGEKVAYNLDFVTEETERQFEDFNITDKLSDEEISDLEHPIMLPVCYKYINGYDIGDHMTILTGVDEVDFVVAGFFEAGLLANDGSGKKVIVTEQDYERLSAGFDQYTLVGFDYGKAFDKDSFIDLIYDRFGLNLTNADFVNVDIEEETETSFLSMFTYFIAFMSLITFIMSIVMIRRKISNDIEDQMEKIGVLEALGYSSEDISMTYIMEYTFLAGIGAVLGMIAAMLMNIPMDTIIRQVIGREVHADSGLIRAAIVALLVVLIILAFALGKARMVKKYPPVVAFRKGIKTHHFKSNIMPLQKTKMSINHRIAIRDCIKNVRGNIGIMVCIIVASIGFLFTGLNFYFFKDGSDSIMKLMGMEAPDESVLINEGVDPQQMADEFLAMPEVDEVLLTYNWGRVKVDGSSNDGTVMVYEDYSQTRNIFVSSGRTPEYANEVAISLARAKQEDISIGDSIVVQSFEYQESYIVTGIIGAMSNGQMNIYMTIDGYMRINGGKGPDVLNVYLKDGEDSSVYEKKISDIYGDDGRIVRVTALMDLAKVQVDPISSISRLFCFVASIFIAAIVAVILSIIATSNVKRKRRDLGVMKSLGYSSKDLMTQIAWSIIPVSIIAVIIGTFLGIYVNNVFWLLLFGAAMNNETWLIVVLDILLVVFCYVSSYIAAGKIRKISVTELMTE